MAAFYTFEDYSGSSTPNKSENPYDGLIETCNSDASKIQAIYQKHRTNRNAQQKTKLLAPDFSGVLADQILMKLEDPSIEPGFKDWRNCLVFWARPPAKVRTLISEIQKKLLAAEPSVWTMPLDNLHMTALEITHSLTAQEVNDLVDTMNPDASEIADYTAAHRARLVKPVISFDAQAFALSFIPAAGEPGRIGEEDAYTYHHLRRDLFTKSQAAGVKVASRYVIPSAHLTISRFTSTKEFETNDGSVDHAKVAALVDAIEQINQWLEKEYWPSDDSIKEGGEWIVGEEKGLDYRKGTLWYGGGGETIYLGKGF